MTDLTDRERAVLVALADGTTQDEMARAMYVGVTAIKNTTAALYRKLGARNGAHAVNIAWKRGLIGDPDDRRISTCKLCPAGVFRGQPKVWGTGIGLPIGWSHADCAERAIVHQGRSDTDG